MTKYQILQVDHRFAILTEVTVNKERQMLKAGDKMFSLKTGKIIEVEYNCGTYGYTSGPAFLYFRPHHLKIVKFITQKDIKQLVWNKNKKNIFHNH